MLPGRLLHPMFATALALAAAGPVAAQPNPYYPPPYYPGYGPGSTLAGAAQVIQAQGQLGIDQEQQRIQRQKYYQEKLNTKKMAFDEAAYEKANTPSYIDDKERVMGLVIRRMMSQPQPAEIVRGDTLNTLMPYIKALSDQGTLGPPQSLNPSVLASINVATPSSGGGGTSVGVLKNGGKLAWPLMLKGPLQKKMDALLPDAVQQASAGTLEPTTYNKLVSLAQSMQDDVRTRYGKDEIDSGTFLRSKRYLSELESSLKVLQDADAAKYLSGAFTARGGNVPELVDNMTADGLKFAPATPGSESAYFSLHNSFVSYIRAAQNAGGFQSSLALPPNFYDKKAAK
jgi:hypothetical protein